MDTRLHNDCDLGQCWACMEDKLAEERKRAGNRAWFNPDPPAIATPEEAARMDVEEAVRATLPKQR
jgi:hypothetical protein